MRMLLDDWRIVKFLTLTINELFIPVVKQRNSDIPAVIENS